MKAQDLKKSILQLAIQGKLVPQDTNDESAEVLYAKIQAEKQKLIKEGKIKKDKPLSPITDDEVPFEIPQSWKWVRLGNLIKISSGDGLTSYQMDDTGKIPVYGGNGITGYHTKANVHKRTIVIGRVGYYCGSVHLTEEEAWVTDNAFIVTYSEENIYREFLMLLLNFANFNKTDNATAQPVISGKKVYPIMIPLPPLAEQKRIVAKIEELEPLVKQYDKAETELSVLNDSFPEQLKKSILQYAIQGKLVTQDANDESAEVLYTKIQAEKQKLIKEGKIKKNKPLSPITDDEIPFAIPPSWKWVRLKDLGIINPRNNLSDSIEVTFLPMNCIYSDFYKDIDTSNKKKWGEVKSGYTHIAENDVIMAKITPCFENGKSAIAKNLLNGYGAATTEIHVFRRVIELNLNYILVYLKSPFFMDYATKHMTGTAGQKRVPQNIFAEYFFPLPPFTEQHRIVAKVNELMQYCEKLKI